MNAAPSRPAKEPQVKPRTWRYHLLVTPVRCLGWLAWCWILLASLLHGTDFGRKELEGVLGRRLEALGSHVKLEGVRVDWLGPGLTVERLTVSEGEREHLFLNNIYISAHYSWDGGIALNRIDIDRGRLLVSESGIDDVRALTDGRESAEVGANLHLPAVEVRDLAVSIELPGGQVAALGTFELSMKEQNMGYSKLLGRILLPKSSQADAAPELFLSGLAGDDGQLEMHAIVKQFELSDLELSALAQLVALPAELPRGRVSVHAQGSLQLVGALDARGELRVQLTEGSLRIPGSPEPVQDIDLNFAGVFRPGPDDDFWTPGAWRGNAQVKAIWDGQAIRGGVTIGSEAGQGHVLQGWAQAPRFTVNTPALVAMESPRLLPILFNALDPVGQADVRVGFSVADDSRSADLGARLEFLGRVDNLGQITAAYHGWPNPDRPGVKPMSFAMPATLEKATVVFAHTPRFPRRQLLDIRFAGSHANGPLDGSYQSWSNPIDMPPFARGYGKMEADILLRASNLQVNQEMDRRLEELWELPALGKLFEVYGARSGQAAAQLQISTRASLPTPAVLVDIQLQDVVARYDMLPVPVTGAAGRILVVDGGQGKSAVGFSINGQTATSGTVQVAGHVRSEAADPAQIPRPQRFSLIRVTLDSVQLPGTDLDRLKPALPRVIELIDDFQPNGTMSFEFTRSQMGQSEVDSWMEATPLGGGFQLLPALFPVPCGSVRGRVLVEFRHPQVSAGEELPSNSVRVTTRVAPLTAIWKGKVPVALQAEFPSDMPSRGDLYGAGFPTDDTVLIGQVLAAAGKDADGILANLEDLELGGHVDFDYHFTLPVEESTEAIHGYNLRIRDVDVKHEDGLAVGALRGEVVFSEGRFHAETFTARIGSTPIRLDHLEITESEDGPEGFTMTADISESLLQLNPDLLQQFMGKEVATSLFDEFDLRGTLEILRASVALKISQDSPVEISLRGKGTFSNAAVTIGLPVSIRSALLTIEDFSVVGDDIRGWGRVEDLYGQAIGRDIAQTNLLFSVHGSQVTIQKVDSLFCRGTVRGLGSEDSRAVPAPVFSVDLQPPYHFQAGLEFKNVDVRLLLEDVFSSGIADRGMLDASFRLNGNLEDLLGIRGSGTAQVRETVLWSVPVLRELLSQLGMDETAIFDAMGTDFRIADGKVFMEGMSMRSPILKLRGKGVLGLDGTLHQDLEVHYSLVDKAGIFGDLVHWLQSNLIAISVRGDMSRPQILLRGVFSNPFTDLDDNWRGLPSPGYRPLPDRN